MEKQPAKVNYFFGEGYVDFKNLIVTIFSRVFSSFKHSWECMCDHAGDFIECFTELPGGYFGIVGHLFMMAMFFFRAIMSIIIAVPFCAVLSLVQGALLIVVMGLFYLAYLLVKFADWVYRSVKKISTSCPSCQEKYALPVYKCTCGAEHTKLVPSKYGVFHRECECGKKIATTFFNGRQKSPGKWKCPSCGYVLSGDSMQVDIPIPVVGGPSSGKTCFISMALTRLEQCAASDYSLDFSYNENKKLGDDYAANKKQMSGGRLPLKTNDARLRYYQFYLNPPKTKVSNLISLCDVAGETYEHNDEMGKQIGFKYANAFLMIIDPLTVTAYRDEIADEVDVTKYGASARPMDEVVDALIRTLENMKCIDSHSKIKTDVAVVFTKCDIPGLDEKIGKAAVMRHMSQTGEKSFYDAQNAVCERFLTEYEEDNLLSELKSKFKSVQFFATSALGHPENGEAFTPDGVEEPVLWLIDKCSASINLKTKWGKKI